MKLFQPYPFEPPIHLDKSRDLGIHLNMKKLAFASMKHKVMFIKFYEFTSWNYACDFLRSN
jgi:hypothetical protein